MINAVTIFLSDFAEHNLTDRYLDPKERQHQKIHHLFAEGVIKVAMSVFHVRKHDQGSTISGRVLQGFAALLQPFEFINTDGRIM